MTPHKQEHAHEHDPETLRHHIDVRRQVIENTLSQMSETPGQGQDGTRKALEGKLLQLEAILGEGNWEHLPPNALAELCDWLDEPVP